ncbi:ester cyclase [Glycomyces sp. NPDC047010]|uniref:ester cyclase n=1 Tax=Glycomyces sp. NPDC047010 TaxID=3155023 RepID=UPI0033FCF42B
MTTDHDANIALVRSAFAAFNESDLDATIAFLTEDFAVNIAGMPHQERGHEAWARNFTMMHAAFPGIQASIEDIFAADDKVTVRLTFTGTHGGEFLGMEPTGRGIEYTSIEIYRIEDGMLAEEWICSDGLTMMRQLTDA